MIATALIFVLGVLTATLVSLLAAPVVWYKAQRFALRQYEATIPDTANEIRAQSDAVRAKAALSVRAGEIAVAQAREKMVLAEADLGRKAFDIARLQSALSDVTEELQRERAEVGEAEAASTATKLELYRLRKELQDARREAFRRGEDTDVMAKRVREIEAASETKRLAAADLAGMAALREEVAALTAALAERDARIAASAAQGDDGEGATSAAARIRAALAGHQTGKAFDDRTADEAEAGAFQDDADLRERIADIAARMIAMTALAEGPASPLAAMIATPEGADALSPAPDRSIEKPRGLSLIERVRLLAIEDDAARRAEAANSKGRGQTASG